MYSICNYRKENVYKTIVCDLLQLNVKKIKYKN